MPSAVTTVLLMGALMVASAIAQSYTDEELTTMCANNVPEPCRLSIPGAYQLNDYTCVKISTTEKDFQGALAECGSWRFRSYLVVLKNAEEQKKLLCMMKQASPQRIHYWLGVLRDGKKYYRIDEGKEVTYAAWAEGQPNNANGQEGCVWINSDTWGLWDDVRCTETAGVACQVRV
ncbi:C-type isolectin Sp-CL4-like [Dunckerocampus dactyliophorus]|uniref:C-type isolectin Sp-CL4-like n=1 Tax=Dunckerocampus dactyliophorus TaxID=161453 RepID=UPI00240683DA|nr:C-type isolectin Sp-CL4-like [Dunckerocampus dactyliophorus]XP_054627189.1 C-type isolectin Sp-CL4-like [Dunckerocampus dactyliophorus]